MKYALLLIPALLLSAHAEEAKPATPVAAPADAKAAPQPAFGSLLQAIQAAQANQPAQGGQAPNPFAAAQPAAPNGQQVAPNPFAGAQSVEAAAAKPAPAKPASN